MLEKIIRRIEKIKNELDEVRQMVEDLVSSKETPIENVDLGPWIYNKLKRADIITLEMLLSLGDGGLRENFRWVKIEATDEALQKLGLRRGMKSLPSRFTREAPYVKHLRHPILCRSVEDLELPKGMYERVQNCFRNVKLRTIGEVVTEYPVDLLVVKNFGRKCLVALEDALKKLDPRLRLSMDKKDLAELVRT